MYFFRGESKKTSRVKNIKENIENQILEKCISHVGEVSKNSVSGAVADAEITGDVALTVIPWPGPPPGQGTCKNEN